MSSRLSNKVVWSEMARRKLQFHPDQNWYDITLWGLFSWGAVSHLIKSGDLVTHMSKHNKIVWVRPSATAYHKHIEPLLNNYPLAELQVMADAV